ncbi:coenzyme F420-0:L-glutamate ligase [Candidatus Kaiserbacteria bacterium]|nr:coenzyme F420-0:L-glutamate ligase [Candidatus Kaiserbacteria bacterium]
MHIEAIKTHLLTPPQDDLFKAIQESNLSLSEEDVLVVSSKVVAIHEGRCVLAKDVDKESLVEKESDVYIKDADSRWRICIKHGTFLSGAGIDESNADEHLILLPEDPHKSAREIHEFLTKTYNVKKLGVIVADSHSAPLRYGTVGVALGWYGCEPVSYYTGKPDLFNRPAQFTRINVVDSLAVAGVFAMGELAEQTPLCHIQDIPHIVFTNRDTSQELFIPPREDIYWPLLKNLYT